MSEPILIFPYGEAEGILNSKVAQKQKSSYAEQPIRELLQNSFDAADAIKRKADIHFVVEEIDINEMPLYKQYKREFNNIKNYWEGKNVESMARKEFGKITEALQRPKIKILSVIDNGNGFSRGRIESLFEQSSNKGGYKDARGSYGQGHLTAYGLSDFRYVTYVGKSKDNGRLETIYSGSVILAGQEDEDRKQLGCRGRLLAEKPTERARIRDYKYPSSSSLPGFLKKHYDKIKDTGSIVSIVGFNGDLDEKFQYIIVSNFFMAMLNKQISVSITKDGKTTTLDENMIRAILKEHQSRVNRIGGAILPGRETYKAYRVIRDKECLKEIKLDERNKVKCYIDIDDEKPQFMAIFRGGMIVSSNRSIALKSKLEQLPNISQRRKFSVLITLEQSDCPGFYNLMKEIEDPHHKELDIKNASQKDRDKIKNYCDNLYDGIIKHVPELETEDFLLPILRLSLNRKILPKVKIRKISVPPPGPGVREETDSPSPNPNPEPRPSPKPRPGYHDFKGKISYRINNDNSQISIQIVLEEADDDKRLSVVIREDTGYDNNIINNGKELRITGYCLKRNSEVIKEENNKKAELVYVNSILKSEMEYLLIVFYETPTNPQPVLEPSVAYVKPRKG